MRFITGYQLIIKITICLTLNFCVSQIYAQAWEVHLNLRDINYLVNNQTVSLLVKKKVGDQTYFRLGLDGYFNSTSTGTTAGTTSAYSIGIRPGLEKRTSLSQKLFLVRGADLIYQNGGTVQYPQTATNFSYDVHSNELGVSPFIGLHYAISSHFAFLTEIHLEMRGIWSKGVYKSQQPIPDRTDKLTNWNVNFLPFRYLTVAYTF